MNISLEMLLTTLILPCAIALAIGICLYIIARFVLNGLVNIMSKKSEEEIFDVKKIKKYIRNITLSLVIAAYIIIIALFLSLVYDLRHVFQVFTTPIYTSGKTTISIISIFSMLILGYVAYWISSVTRKITKMILPHISKDKAKHFMPLVHIIGYGVMLLIFLMGLSFIGIDISSFVVVFGVLGVGIGFGLQDIVANFFSGLVIGFSGIITEGDRVFIQGVEGNVQEINLINTVIRSISYEELIVPNRFILNESIQNFSHSDSYAVVGTSVGVSYNSDMHLVQKILEDTGRQLPWTLKNKDIYFRMKSFDDSCITVAIYVWIADIRQKKQAVSDLNMLVWENFKKANIEIPYPQLDITVKK